MIRYLKLIYQCWRWNALRGGWLLDHVLHHRPFDGTRLDKNQTIDVIVAIVDHFEPTRRDGTEAAGQSVESWCASYESMAEKHCDADGRPPQHTWFYRFEYLNPQCVRHLSNSAFRGYGEIDFHLHHGFDHHNSFSEKLQDGLLLANLYGAMLTAEEQPSQRFAYIAGNWSLDNGSRDDSKSGCNTELIALREAGCYADFTFPAIGSKAQPKKTNAIYYATDCPNPKSYNMGPDVRVGGEETGDLMIIEGPLVMDWKSAGFKSAAIESYALPTPSRIIDWLKANIHVQGNDNWIFVKLHTHGMQSRDAWHDGSCDAMFDQMESHWNQHPFRLHYATAREMYNIIKAAEAGHDGNPTDFRDFTIAKPANRLFNCNQPWRLVKYTKNIVEIEFTDEVHKTICFASTQLTSIIGNLRYLKMELRENRVVGLKIYGRGEFNIRSDSPLDFEPSYFATVEIENCKTS